MTDASLIATASILALAPFLRTPILARSDAIVDAMMTHLPRSEPSGKSVSIRDRSETNINVTVEGAEGDIDEEEIAARVDTSVQNASYHLRTLTDVGLVRVVDTVYSEKGCEMNLYYAVDTALLLETTPTEEYSDR